MERQLATIQIIKNLEPILNADRIEKATILDWECVVKKDDFKVGDKCIYIEIDSLLPEHKYFEFMKDRKYRVKTIKLKQQISQGLVLPLNCLLDFNNKIKLNNLKENDDVTEILGITKWVSQSEKEVYSKQEVKMNFVVKFLYKYLKRYTFFRKLFLKSDYKSSFPRFLIKTDELRIQSIYSKIEKYFNDSRLFYITQKMDGTSGTFYWKDNVGGICSRNIEIFTSKQKTFHEVNVYYDINKKYDILNKLKKYKKQNKINISIQGEIVGPNVACGVKGATGIKELDFFVFNVYDITNKKYFNLEEILNFCSELGLKFVPLLYVNYSLKGIDLNKLLELSKGYYNFDKDKKDLLQEGIVIRPMEEEKILEIGRFSFKVINNDYLLKYKL